MPSSGLLPFLQSYICELNSSCYSYPRDSNFDSKYFIQLAQVTSNITNKLSEFQNVTSLSDIGSALQPILNNNLTLNQLGISKILFLPIVMTLYEGQAVSLVASINMITIEEHDFSDRIEIL